MPGPIVKRGRALRRAFYRRVHAVLPESARRVIRAPYRGLFGGSKLTSEELAERHAARLAQREAEWAERRRQREEAAKAERSKRLAQMEDRRRKKEARAARRAETRELKLAAKRRHAEEKRERELSKRLEREAKRGARG